MRLETEGPEHTVMPALSDALQRQFTSVALFRERYEGWELLGVGGFGAVVRTVCRDTDLEVALKLWVNVDSAGRQRFQNELHSLVRVLHPNVVRVFSAFAAGSLTWLEMEYVAGITLADALRRRVGRARSWPLSQVLHIGAAVAQGLDAAHAAGVVHRDVTPNNILLPASRRPAAKLADFGIATLRGRRARPVRDLIGAPPYVAPELFRGDRATPAADVYALCVTLYQMLTGGHYPYLLPQEPNLVALVRAHTRSAFVPLPQIAPELPTAVIDVVHAGLAKTPRRRPSAKRVAEVLIGTMAEIAPPPRVR